MRKSEGQSRLAVAETNSERSDCDGLDTSNEVGTAGQEVLRKSRRDLWMDMKLFGVRMKELEADDWLRPKKDEEH